MKKIFKITTLVLIIAVFFTLVAFADNTISVTTFSDMNETYWASDSIEKLVEAGIISGYPDGTFKPDGYINRAELVKITNMVFSFTTKQDNSSLTDIKVEDWFYENVLIAQNAGYINGYPDGTFKPNDYVTRQELCKILDAVNNFVELPLDNIPADEISPWAAEYVNKVLSNRIMLLDSSNNFRATEKATRAEVCEALAKFVIAETEEPVVSGGGGGIPSSDEMTQEELYDTMDTVIRRLELGVVSELSTPDQKEIVNDIITNMEKYQENNSYDYETAAENTYEKYKDLSVEEKEELKELIQVKNTTSDLLDLKEFFFPDVQL